MKVKTIAILLWMTLCTVVYLVWNASYLESQFRRFSAAAISRVLGP